MKNKEVAGYALDVGVRGAIAKLAKGHKPESESASRLVNRILKEYIKSQKKP